MSVYDLWAISPLMALAAGALAVMLGIAIRRSHKASVLVAMGSLLAALMLLEPASTLPGQATILLIVDGFSIFYTALILSAGLAICAMAYGYLQKQPSHREEFYVLLLLSLLGATVLVGSTHFVSFFLGLEILSVSLYALIAYRRENLLAIEAGAKYLVLAGMSSAILLFGMALIYTQTGTMSFGELASATKGPLGVIMAGGLALMLAGIGFKLALVPFHMWTPDVYQGAPAPVTALIATVSKGAMFALLLRYLDVLGIRQNELITAVLTVIAIASMLTGNLLALLQDNVKRMLAYSSIAHLGYLLVALVAAGDLASTAVSFYLVAYFVTTLGAFGVVTILSDYQRDADSLEDYRELLWRHPVLAGVLGTMLLSLAGIPLTAGFAGKFLVLSAGVQSHLWLLVAMLVINSAVGLFYYLRVITAMCMHRPHRVAPALLAYEPSHKLAPAGVAALAVLTAALLYLGALPSGLMRLIEATVLAAR